ncbi:MAG: hypothetical protein AB8F78_13865 [Saprospiraceae bacterium]
MCYARGLWPIACLLLASGFVKAQTIFHNDGGVVHVTSGAVIFVEGGIDNHNDGLLNNGGTIHFSENWSSNTAVSDDVDALDGTFIFEGVSPLIYGSGTVAFPSVTLSPVTELARQIETNVSFSQTLDIAEAIWATGSNVASVLNTDPDAILRGDGYISSDSIGGYLTRRTDRIADYIYPVGSTGTALRIAIERYRPVIVTPLDAAPNEFAVRFANIDPTNDFTDGGSGFDRALRDPALTQINQNFYYQLDRLVGTTPADLKFFYLQTDGRYSTVAQVQDNDVWRDMYGSVDVNVIEPLHTEGLDRVAVLLEHNDFTQPVFTQAGADADNDGIADRLDLDADNDGIANIDEVVSDPYGDHDGDGYFDYVDADFPGCGPIINQICSGFDFDRDGFANHLDLDSDGDGIYDIFEAGGIDLDLDAQVDYPIAGISRSMIDTDNDGFNDAQDHLDGMRSPDGMPEVTNGTPWLQDDRDNDGLVNFQDIDSDGDGIVDFIEGQTTVGYFFPDYVDGNLNGIDQAFDLPENGTYAVLPTDTDGDGQPDYLDLNSDNERTSDLAEGNDTSGDGLIADADLPLGTDADNDGLDDAFDTIVLTATPNTNAENAQFAELMPNLQDPGTTELDWREQGCKQQNCQTIATIRN